MRLDQLQQSGFQGLGAVKPADQANADSPAKGYAIRLLGGPAPGSEPGSDGSWSSSYAHI